MQIKNYRGTKMGRPTDFIAKYGLMGKEIYYPTYKNGMLKATESDVIKYN